MNTANLSSPGIGMLPSSAICVSAAGTILFRTRWSVEPFAWVSASAKLSCSAKNVSALVGSDRPRSEEHTSELQSQSNLVCRLLLEKKKKTRNIEHQQKNECRDEFHIHAASARSIRNRYNSSERGTLPKHHFYPARQPERARSAQRTHL